MVERAGERMLSRSYILDDPSYGSNMHWHIVHLDWLFSLPSMREQRGSPLFVLIASEGKYRRWLFPRKSAMSC